MHIHVSIINTIAIPASILGGLVQPSINQDRYRSEGLEAPKRPSKKASAIGIDYAVRMNVIRFVSMCSIVLCHCLFNLENDTFPTLNSQIIQVFILQAGRLGTIAFFIISGFFLTRRLQDFTVLNYLRHRFFKIILPWIGALLLFVTIQFLSSVPLSSLANQTRRETTVFIVTLVKDLMMYTSYWFIPIAITAACIIIIFKKYVNSLWFGLLLAGITLFYCVNLYFGWISAQHTKAVLGYTFFLWLGTQLYRYQHKAAALINKTPWIVFIAAASVLFPMACIEAIGLRAFHSTDPFASIRFSNILLSVVFFIMLLKTKKLDAINALQPQRYIYGVYLLHSILIALVVAQVHKAASRGSIGRTFFIELTFFLFIFLFSYILAVVIKSFRGTETKTPNKRN